MSGSAFLARLREERRLERGDPSPEISASYLKKSADCLKASKILFREGLYENAIGEAYFSMYDAALSLLFYCGIKCENHSAAMILLKELFKLERLSASLSFAKRERIDKQYYVADKSSALALKNSSFSLIRRSEEFILEARAYMERLTSSEIGSIQEGLGRL